jgi:hypothetical protein
VGKNGLGWDRVSLWQELAIDDVQRRTLILRCHRARFEGPHIYDGSVDIHVTVNQRVADNLRPDHAESFPCKLVAESSGMEKFTKERYIVLQNSEWRMLTRFIAIIGLWIVIMGLLVYRGSAWFLQSKSGN